MTTRTRPLASHSTAVRAIDTRAGAPFRWLLTCGLLPLLLALLAAPALALAVLLLGPRVAPWP